ncbi:MAG TPA: outer membrane beta-barrel protein [Verrucomicrobiae bacterium]|nr:outer membrane beta-barrel protein [Verrucomicrobiae bacterium]
MKKIFVSAGLAAIGALSLHADEYAPDFTAMNAAKPWTVSGTLRGFYDDNITTSPNGSKTGSAGFEFSPQVSLIMPLQQTELGLRYTYGLYYYQQRENQGSNPIDQSHEADLWIDHAFTQRLEGKIQDTFISQQDPALSSSPTALPYRVQGNNIQNVGTLSAHYEWSLLFSSDLGYQNTWVDYANTTGNLFQPSYAGLLNEDEHSGWVTLNYQYLPDLALMAKYTFTWDDYTANQAIGPNFIRGVPQFNEIYYSDSRNQISHNIQIGAQYSATANLSILAWAGVGFYDNYNLPAFDTQPSTSIQPTANIVATYTYLPGDYVQVGFTESAAEVATADVNTSSGALTEYQEASVLFASVNHQITPKLTASLTGHYQYSTFVSGNNDGEAQDWYSFGINLAYEFTPWVSADIGYNAYYLTTTAALPGYSRNVGYASVTASF